MIDKRQNKNATRGNQIVISREIHTLIEDRSRLQRASPNLQIDPLPYILIIILADNSRS